VKLEVSKKSWVREVKADGPLASGPEQTGDVSFYWKMEDGCFDPDAGCDEACECFNEGNNIVNLVHEGFDLLPADLFGPLPPGGGESIWGGDLIDHLFAGRADVPWQNADYDNLCNCDCEGSKLAYIDDGECVCEPECWLAGFCAGDLCCYLDSTHPHDPACGEKETKTSLAISINITGITMDDAALCDQTYTPDCPVQNTQG